MEKIRSAIAKARAARASESGVLPVTRDETRVRTALDTRAPDPENRQPPAVPNAAEGAAIAARWQSLPSFAPSPALMARGHIVTFTGSEEAVHFDVMRTRLLQLMRSNGWRRVAITSPGPACGKSTLALNLAFTLGRQPGLRTLLLEMDLRRPSLARMLGLRDRHYAAKVLEGREPLAQNAVRHGENLAISTQTGPAPRPAELLHSPATAASLSLIEAEYDPAVILCDLPPVFVGDDAMSVMGQMDAALIVAAAGSTTISQIDRCEREIAAQTNVIGIVLNKCRHMENDYGYDYHGG